MALLRFTLLGEGTSDDALLFIIQKVLELPEFGLLPAVDFYPIFVSPKDLDRDLDLSGRMRAAIEVAPCDLLFVHQDADRRDGDPRAAGIRARAGGRDREEPIVIPVVPVREMEAWLLLDESAICRAVGVRRPSEPLRLPQIHQVETISDPKQELERVLSRAIGGSARRRGRASDVSTRRIAESLGNISQLRRLPAFQAFEADVRRVIEEQGWPERLPG
ncbi:MAG: hypothetical protein AB7K36_22880 [Chloroflexota bacterium]